MSVIQLKHCIISDVKGVAIFIFRDFFSRGFFPEFFENLNRWNYSGDPENKGVNFSCNVMIFQRKLHENLTVFIGKSKSSNVPCKDCQIFLQKSSHFLVKTVKFSCKNRQIFCKKLQNFPEVANFLCDYTIF